MSIIDELADQPDKLRKVALFGTLAGTGEGAWPMWVLSAAAPAFKRQNAYNDKQKPSGTTADHAHPLRVLSADQVDARQGMRPRLMSLHLVMGARNPVYRERGENLDNPDEDPDRDALLLGWSHDRTVTAKPEHGRMMRSVTEAPDASKGDAPFVHVTAELLPDGLPSSNKLLNPAGWTNENSGADVIGVAPMRLVAGRVGLYVNPNTDGMKWLGKLGIEGWSAANADASTWPRIWLVPDGIEFDAQLQFPGRPAHAAPLIGRVLLHPDQDSAGRAGFRLTLVEAADPALWWRAWREIVPAAGNDSERLTGLRFSARTSGVLPAFSWPVALDGGAPGPVAKRTVEVAPCELAIALASPVSMGAVDSVATLRLERVKLFEKNITDQNGATRTLVTFGIEVTVPAGAAGPDLVCHCKVDSFEVRLPPPANGSGAATLSLDVELARLAGQLRAAYGIAAPPPVPVARAAGLSYGSEFARPLLPAFVALDNGWLQLPIPNLGPLDTSSDQVLSPAQVAGSPSVLNGFLRLRHGGLGSEVQSGYHPERTPARGRGAPWALTVEQAAGVSGAIHVLPRGAGSTGQLDAAVLTLIATVLSARGLLWFSADRPDAQEALPRLGAGPASFVDALMQTASGVDAARSPLMASFGSFAIVIPRDQKTKTAVLVWDNMTLRFRTGSARWQHEVLRPREAREALERAGDCIMDGFPRANESTAYRQQMDYVQSRSGLFSAQLGNAATQLPRMCASLDALAAVPALKKALALAVKGLKSADEGTRSALNQFVHIKNALGLASDALPQDLPQSRPWPAVAWLRHPIIPAVATMPMTRAASGSSRPLESRDLLPYALLKRVAVKENDRELVTLAQLRPVADSPLLMLDGGRTAVFDLRALRQWPHAGVTGDARPQRGIGMAAVGIPGVELRPLRDPPPSGMAQRFEGAVHLDLPLLDEAFATASLPPPEGAAAEPERSADSVPTALDWPLLIKFWQAQEHKQQNSRVVDSYLSGFVALDLPSTVEVNTLVRGLSWSTSLKIDTTADAAGAALPYGTLSIGSQDPASGNTALTGYSGSFTHDLAAKTLTPSAAGAGTVDVLGFSPATFAVDGIEFDNCMSGASPAIRKAQERMMVRPVTFADPDHPGARHELRSLMGPEQVTLGAYKFEFWFKDVLFNGDVAQLPTPKAPLPVDALAFDTLDRDALLAASSFEWRFAPADAVMAGIALALGRNELPIGGLRLEPLRLLSLSMDGDRVAAATLQCRLMLDPRNDPANLVVLHLEKDGPALAAHLTLADSTTALEFGFDIADPVSTLRGQSVRRRVRATAAPTAKGVKFGLLGRSLEVQVADTMVALGVPDIDLGDGKDGWFEVQVSKRWNGRIVGQPGVSRLRIEHANLSAGYRIVVDDDISVLREVPARLSWNHFVEIFPEGEHANPLLPAIAWDLSASPSLTLMDQRAHEATLMVEEANGAIALSAVGAKFTAAGKTVAMADGALLARLGAQRSADGTIALAAGHGEALIIQKMDYTSAAGDKLLGPGLRIQGGRVALRASGDGQGHWRGDVSVSAQIAASSDIAWPSVKAKVGLEVSLPRKDKKPNNGRVMITAGSAGAARDEVRWVLDGHRLSLNLATSLCKRGSQALWVTPVVTHHTLTRDGKVLRWSGIESLAVGRPAALVPALPADLLKDAKTLATRYAHAIVESEYEPRPEAGMVRAGFGAVATVLQGALGKAFRSLYQRTDENDRIMLAGGFLGLLKLDANAHATPLLRLPVLAGLGLTLHQSDLEKSQIDLAWSDGTATRAVALTRATAPSPSSASFEALAAALMAGSLARSPEGAEAEAITAALLVEQSFGTTFKGPDATLAGTPFFLAAAVSVSAILDRAAQAGALAQPDSLSLVSGVLERSQGKLALAASVAMRAAQPMDSKPRASATLYILGQEVSEIAWPHATTSESAAQLAPHLRAMAPGHDPDPAGFLLALYDQAGAVTYVGGTIASLALDTRIAPRSATAAFTDGRRGLPAMPGTQDQLRWLASPREGASAPIRDATLVDGVWQGSGLAALASQMTLPANARDWDIAAIAMKTAPLVWLSSAQVPVYLSLNISGLRGTPVSWLQPAPPLVRLPIDQDVVDAIRASQQEQKDAKPAKLYVQPFLPGHVAHASVGERAGILTLRRTRLLARLDAEAANKISAFDASHQRFGAPGQAGSSWARKLRTPRPGPLPVNRGDGARDRRIQASGVRPLDCGSALLGSADIVQGGPGEFAGSGRFEAWAIQVVACPESVSVVSERWDGVVQLICRVEVRLVGSAGATKPGMAPVRFLAAALFGDGKQLGAQLNIDEQVVRYRWLKQSKVLSDWRSDAVTLPGQTVVAWHACAAEVTLILDPRASPFETANPVPFAPIVAALAASSGVPRMELQWTVLPRSLNSQPDQVKDEMALAQPDPKHPALVEGSVERSSLTLRMPLYPVMQAQGALALTPATLIFSDPAYDRDLAGPPASARVVLEANAPNDLDKRGDLRLTFYADRGRVNRTGVVTMMLDIAYERRMDELAQAAAERAGAVPGGDLVPSGGLPTATLTINLVGASGKARVLRFGSGGDTPLSIKLASVVEMPLAQLVEQDGVPARLAPGDMLQIDAALTQSASVWLWDTGAQKAVPIAIKSDTRAHCLLALTLADEAVVEPPPALYLALQRGVNSAGQLRMSVPLHAQSPLPRRVDLTDPARGFRSGLLQRHADFIWYLSSTAAMLGAHSIVPIKSDRNGQGYWPVTASELLTPENYYRKPAPLRPRARKVKSVIPVT
ncbi:hypothetical protein [Janthinobacterium sp. MDT1-19]|uniref:hypothetical protein n=1 Tax=Janthinobacterium sp. MDT1-19 TaxID=1259339 RepID=UPI003F211825